MPVRTIPAIGLEYYLVCVDGTGEERTDDPDGLDGRLTRRVEEALAGKPYTDVFLMSHGWMGDVPAASGSTTAGSGRWRRAATISSVPAMSDPGSRRSSPGSTGRACRSATRSSAADQRSLFSTGAGAAALPDAAALVDAYADRIADTPSAREALATIFAAAAANTSPPELSPDIANAYRVLDRESGLGAGGPANAPGSDREPFDPESVYEACSTIRRRASASAPSPSARWSPS